MIFSQEKKEGEDSDEEGKEGAAVAAGKPASDSDEDSESEEEEVHVVNIAVIFQENGSKFILGITDFPVWFPFTSTCRSLWNQQKGFRYLGLVSLCPSVFCECTMEQFFDVLLSK